MGTRLPAAAALRALALLLLLVTSCVAQQIEIMRQGQTANLVGGATQQENAMVGSRVTVVFMVGRDSVATEMRIRRPSTSEGTWASISGFVGHDGTANTAYVLNNDNDPTGDDPVQLTLTLDGGAVAQGTHDVTMVTTYQFKNNGNNWPNTWLEAIVSFRFTVSAENYYVLAVPQDSTLQPHPIICVRSRVALRLTILRLSRGVPRTVPVLYPTIQRVCTFPHSCSLFFCNGIN